MSVFRRLYNVAYGKVRLWQTDEGDRPDPEAVVHPTPSVEVDPVRVPRDLPDPSLVEEGEPLPERRPRRL